MVEPVARDVSRKKADVDTDTSWLPKMVASEMRFFINENVGCGSNINSVTSGLSNRQRIGIANAISLTPP
jgi:hypothetical protein